MVLVQKWPFFQPFFLGNIDQENFFYDILERWNVFLGFKNKKFKKSRNCFFSKEVNPSPVGSSLHGWFYDLILFFLVSSFILILDRFV